MEEPTPTQSWRLPIAAAAALAVAVVVAGWVYWQRPDSLEPKISPEKQSLIVALRNGPTSYYQDQHGASGFEYEFAQQFADSLGLQLEVRTAPSIDAMLEWVREGIVDMAAPGVVISQPAENGVALGPTYHNVDQLVVYSAGKSKPRKPQDLVGKNLEVVSNSGHVYTLARLKLEYPRLTWTESSRGGVESLLEAVNDRAIDATIVDSSVFQIYRRYFPRLRVGFEISSDHDVAWAFAKDDPLNLTTASERFVASAEASGSIEELNARLYGHLPSYAQITTHYYLRHIEDRLSALEPAFLSASEAVNLDWRLLAAIAYQESHWDPAAVSPTGVRGLMMLTLRTARELGIEDREDPNASIQGGARYIRGLIDRMPDRIPEPDRTWMALAAYNIGMGHLEDSRRLTQTNGADPDQWVDVARHLPLLSDEYWYSRTRYGFAHGTVAVRYVEHIRSYYDILRWVDGRRERSGLAESQLVSVGSSSASAGAD